MWKYYLSKFKLRRIAANTPYTIFSAREATR